MKNKKSFLTLGIIVLVLFLGVGYAVVSSVYLNIGGTANVADTELKVEITNVEAETNMTDKTLDFTNVLSNNNLTSNFTLKNMSLNELVTITYTVTNNEKDVDAIISAIDGVDLTNSNPDCFDVNYQITDNETDLENNDKTMEVVVTVELIKTPLNDDDSSTEVGLTLAAIPKGSKDIQIIGPDTTGDILDNVWPIEWNSDEVKNNTTIMDGDMVRVSRLAPSLDELRSSNYYLETGNENLTLYYFGGMYDGQACGAIYSLEGLDSEIPVFSIPVAGDYMYEGEVITVTEPGLYVINVPAEMGTANFAVRKQKNYDVYYIFDDDMYNYFKVSFKGDKITMIPTSSFFSDRISQDEWKILLENDKIQIGDMKTENVINPSYDMNSLSISFDIVEEGLYLINAIDGDSNRLIGIMATQVLPLKETGAKFNTEYTLRFNNGFADLPVKLEFTKWGNCVCTYADGREEIVHYGYSKDSITMLEDSWSVNYDGKEIEVKSLYDETLAVYTVDGFETDKFTIRYNNSYKCVIDNIPNDNYNLDTKIDFTSGGGADIYNPSEQKPAGYYTYKDKKITNSENDYYMVVSDDGNTLTEYRNGEIAYVWQYE